LLYYFTLGCLVCGIVRLVLGGVVCVYRVGAHFQRSCFPAITFGVFIWCPIEQMLDVFFPERYASQGQKPCTVLFASGLGGGLAWLSLVIYGEWAGGALHLRPRL